MEPGVIEGLGSSESLGGVVSEKFVQEVEALITDLGKLALQVVVGLHGIVHLLDVGQLRESWPDFVIGSSQ